MLVRQMGDNAAMVPEVRWARSGEVALAYQVVGEEPRDILLMWTGVTHLDVLWDLPENVDLINSLAALGRVILYEKRGVGLSDRSTHLEALRCGDRLVGASRRCLEYLADTGRADRAPRYGGTGRPELEYRWR